jgi:hypothetical protein
MTPDELMARLTPRGVVVTPKDVREFHKKYGTETVFYDGRPYRVGNRRLCPGMREIYLVEEKEA